ncbi:hypothetical protein Rhopal_000693-T1 [Rhodotorula paludigena]|uniref:Uncharacterized protein n=1 Tax=Rhodotorula paludigena TaxID=86838 RepID=A0AAV5GBR8_9BASI|nr:hypothetical protein Rhopal_000693-T1 [Rhodotorula paludigena]
MPRPARKSVSTVSYADAASDSSDGEARTSSRTANTSKNSKNGTKPRQSTGRDAGEVTDGRMLQDSGDTRLDSSSSDESSDEDDYEATVKRKKRKTGFLPQVPQGQCLKKDFSDLHPMTKRCAVASYFRAGRLTWTTTTRSAYIPDLHLLSARLSTLQALDDADPSLNPSLAAAALAASSARARKAKESKPRGMDPEKLVEGSRVEEFVKRREEALRLVVEVGAGRGDFDEVTA